MKRRDGLMKKLKKLLSVLLSLAMVLSMLPATALWAAIPTRITCSPPNS
jgi:hypothetical protein